jgi:hypothetical protein
LKWRASFPKDDEGEGDLRVCLPENQPENSTLVTGLRDFVPLVFEPEDP